jgi:signal peptidase II
LKARDTLPLWDGVLHLTYVENRGAAFGSFTEARWIFMILSPLLIIAVIGVMIYYRNKMGLSYIIPLSLIAAGGIGNMIDRIFLGYVVDFIDFRLINFAVFNGADSIICIGAAYLAIVMLFLKNDEKGM